MCKNDSEKKKLIRERQGVVVKVDVKIDSITETFFNECYGLQRIEFDNNQISALPEGLFKECKQLWKISFNNNKITALPEGVFNVLIDE